MRTLKSVALIAIGLVLVVRFAHAQIDRLPPTATSPEIIHVNGVWSDEVDSITNTKTLDSALTAHGFPVKDYGVSHVHNPNNAPGRPLFNKLGADLDEVDVQTKWSNEALIAAASSDKTYLQLLGETYNREYRNPARLNPTERRVVQMAGRLKRVIRTRIDAGQRFVIVVPHSQGNLYAEAAYAMLVHDGRVDVTSRTVVVGVAVPANRTPNGSYVTNSQDVVVAAARVRLHDPLPSTVTPCWPTASFCGLAVAPVPLVVDQFFPLLSG